jgi:hypothetical protein
LDEKEQPLLLGFQSGAVPAFVVKERAPNSECECQLCFTELMQAQTLNWQEEGYPNPEGSQSESAKVGTF